MLWNVQISEDCTQPKRMLRSRRKGKLGSGSSLLPLRWTCLDWWSEHRTLGDRTQIKPLLCKEQILVSHLRLRGALAAWGSSCARAKWGWSEMGAGLASLSSTTVNCRGLSSTAHLLVDTIFGCESGLLRPRHVSGSAAWRRLGVEL